MTSGIYTLEFSDGSTYIGKAVDIESRWNQHRDKLLKGQAAAKLQEAYYSYGMPEFKIAHRVHVDHIDIVESILIEQNRNSEYLLNTASGHRVAPTDVDVLIEGQRLLEFSTADHIRSILHSRKQIDQLTADRRVQDRMINSLSADLHTLKTRGIKTPKEWKEYIEELEDELEDLRALKEYADTYSKMGWFLRLFNPFRFKS